MINAFIMAPIFVFANVPPESYSGSQDSSSDAPEEEPKTEKNLFCCITQEAYRQSKAQTVENELRSARTSAPKLIKVIRTNEALGYLDTKNLSSKELYDLLNEHFGLAFKLRTFQDYRSK